MADTQPRGNDQDDEDSNLSREEKIRRHAMKFQQTYGGGEDAPEEEGLHHDPYSEAALGVVAAPFMGAAEAGEEAGAGGLNFLSRMAGKGADVAKEQAKQAGISKLKDMGMQELQDIAKSKASQQSVGGMGYSGQVASEIPPPPGGLKSGYYTSQGSPTFIKGQNGAPNTINYGSMNRRIRP